jgi:hypothetical protein
VFDRTFKLRAGEFDTQYFCLRVIGAFHGQVVSRELITFLNCDHELWSYFAAVGEALTRGIAQPHVVARDLRIDA